MTIRIVQPESNQKCMEWLERSSKQGKKDERFALAIPWFKRAEELLETFSRSRTELLEAHQTLAKERRNERQCVKLLKAAVKDFDRVLFRRVKRQSLPENVFSFYKMPTQRGQPKADGPEGWRVLAEDRIQGDLLAVAAGFAPMAEPGQQELQGYVDESLRLAGKRQEAERIYQAVQLQVDSYRKETLVIWKILLAMIHALTPELSKEARRRLLRTFGYRYRLIKNKGEKSETPPAANESQVGTTTDEEVTIKD